MEYWPEGCSKVIIPSIVSSCRRPLFRSKDATAFCSWTVSGLQKYNTLSEPVHDWKGPMNPPPRMLILILWPAVRCVNVQT